MSQQTILSNYFKSKASPPIMPATIKDKIDLGKTNKRSLSLTKSPHLKKSPRNNAQNVIQIYETDAETLIVSSDSESDFQTPKVIFPPHETNNGNISVRSSTEAVQITCDVSPSIYTQDPQESPSPSGQASRHRGRIFVRNDLTQEFNSNSTESLNVKTPPVTPSKSPRSIKSSGNYFSPTKKRVLTKKSPGKRNLTREFNENIGSSFQADGEQGGFSNACDSHDFKTIFFLTMIDKFLENNGLRCLLDDSSQRLLRAGMEIKMPGMKLVCRLYWRQPVWFQRIKLLEICTKEYKQKKLVIDGLEMQEMIDSLVASGLIQCSAVEGDNVNAMEFDDLAKILSRPQLQDICKDLKLKIQSKQDAVQALMVFSQRSSIAKFFIAKTNLGDNGTRVLKMMRQKAGPCYKLSELARSTLDKLYLLMYLGSDYGLIRDKRLELMLINDKINVETYPVDKDMEIDNASIVFQSKDQFDRYFNAHNMYEDYQAADDAGKKIALVKDALEQYKSTGEEEMLRYRALPTWLRRYTPCNIYVKILEGGVQELKKEKSETSYNLAVDILKTLIEQIVFRQHKRPEWHAEMALIMYKHLDRCEEAAEVLIEGFRSDLSDEAKDFMRPRAIKIAKQQNINLSKELRATLLSHATKEAILEKNYSCIHIYKHPIDNYNQKGKQRFETRTEDGRSTLSAEEYCIIHLVNEGPYTHGEHWEGRIITTIFSLLFWDIIYMKPADAAGVFLSPYQRRPLDMYSGSFYENRKVLIDDRLVFIEESSADMVVDIMQSRWTERPEHETSDIQRSIGWNNIKMVATCLGARAITAICRRLAACYRHAHGFPDLTMWNVHTNKITFIEVKTDADTPSMKQLQWMEYLGSHGVDAAFCYVGANTTRRRARASVLSLSSD